MLTFEQLFVCRDVRLTDDKRLSLLDHGYEFGHAVRQLVVFARVTISHVRGNLPYELEIQSLDSIQFERHAAKTFVLRIPADPLVPGLVAAVFPVAGVLIPGYYQAEIRFASGEAAITGFRIV
ncbi:MAG: hypothetical protein IT462_09190 [Planctomycetes bacterium]|nr:hypothetical protein [Planctomycetota bacterium]